MPVSVRVNGLSVVHQGSEGVSRATLPDVCVTPPANAPAPHDNVAYSRDLAQYPRSVTVDGHAVAHETSIFARSYGDEAGKLGGVTSGTVGGQASWLTHSFDVRIAGRGVCRLTDKMLHNHGNTIDCAGLMQNPVGPAPGAPATKGKGRKPMARAAKKTANTKRDPMEIALPFFDNCMVPGDPVTNPSTTMRKDVIDLACALNVTYFRLFLPYLLVSRPYRSIVCTGPNPPKLGSFIYPYEEIDRFVRAIRAAKFDVEITVHGGASPWTHTEGRFAGGIEPNIPKFARYFEEIVDHYKALGVTRFSVWNEPNHPGFLNAGPYWRTKHGKRRLNQTLELKALQKLFERAKDAENDAELVAAANKKATDLGYAGDLKKIADDENKKAIEHGNTDASDDLDFPTTRGEDGAKLCETLANNIFKAKISKADSRSIARELHDDKRTRYRTFDMKVNAKVYRAMFDACWKRTKSKGVKIWLGELSSGSAFDFIRHITDPKVTGVKKKLKADALALHPYQYLVSPTRKPDSRPIFSPEEKVAPDATDKQKKEAENWNKARQEAIEKKWPADKEKRRKARAEAAGNAGIGAIGAVQALLTRLAAEKRLSGRDNKKLDLYLTEFGYHRRRLHKPQLDRQIPEELSAKWVKLAYDIAYKHGAKQHLYYHLLASRCEKPWDSSLIGSDEKPLPIYDALKLWVKRAELANKVKLKR